MPINCWRHSRAWRRVEVRRCSRKSAAAAGILCLVLLQTVHAQAVAAQRQDEAVGTSINYVFATDLGSGVYNLDGRTLQIYQFKYDRPLRETTPEHFGVHFELPVTLGFFDFVAADVLSSGLPSRVDSFSAVPGLSFDYLVQGDWHLQPYVRAGFSVASSSVDGWLFGAGLRLEHRRDFHGWDEFTRSELALAGIEYRTDVPSDRFARLRQGFDFSRALGWKDESRAIELGIYAIFDVILDPPTAPLVDGQEHPLQAEFGATFTTRPRHKIWRFDAPRLGIGYRLAGEMSAWRLVIGEPF